MMYSSFLSVSSFTEPSLKSVPLFNMPTLSVISSTSERRWLFRKIVFPLAFSSSRISRISFLPIGSTPSVGSSRKISSGSLIIDCAKPSRCIIPFEYAFTLVFFHSVSLTSSSISSILLERCCPSNPLSFPKK